LTYALAGGRTPASSSVASKSASSSSKTAVTGATVSRSFVRRSPVRFRRGQSVVTRKPSALLARFSRCRVLRTVVLPVLGPDGVA
jgi:hypothetical protein